MKLTLVFVTLALFAKTDGHGSLAENNVDSRDKRLLLDEDSIQTLLTRVDSLTKQMESVQATIATMNRPVYFMAELTKSITGTNHHIYFDDVKLNIGNAYNPHHGMFVAPTNGTYQFTITACSGGGHYVVLELTVNVKTIGKVIAGDSSYSECTTKLFLTELKENDDVFVQHVTTGDYIGAIQAYGLPLFTGVLLHAH